MFGAYDPAAGLLRGGFWVDPPGTTCTFPDRGVLHTCHHYGTLNTEPRIASYLGIAFGQVPATCAPPPPSTPPSRPWTCPPRPAPSRSSWTCRCRGSPWFA